MQNVLRSGNLRLELLLVFIRRHNWGQGVVVVRKSFIGIIILIVKIIK